MTYVHKVCFDFVNIKSLSDYFLVKRAAYIPYNYSYKTRDLRFICYVNTREVIKKKDEHNYFAYNQANNKLFKK